MIRLLAKAWPWWGIVLLVSTTLAALTLTAASAGAQPSGFSAVFVLPLAYGLGLFPLCAGLFRRPSALGLWALLLLGWLRYVAIPAIQVGTGSYGDLDAVVAADGHLTVTLMVWEFAVLVVVAILLYGGPVKPAPAQALRLAGWVPAYLLFAAAIAVVCLVHRDYLRLFSLIIVRSSGDGRLGSAGDTSTMAVVFLLRAALLVCAFAAIAWAKARYDREPQLRYLLVALVPAMLLVGVIVGERRSEQIVMTVVMAWLLSRLFPDHRRGLVSTIVGAGVVVVGLLSVYKFFYAFNYGSYLEAISQASFNVESIGTTLDSYFYGPVTTAMNAQFATSHSLGFGQLLYDVVRSTFGPSFLVRGGGPTTSQLFNQAIYGGAQSSGYMFSSAVYGYLYLGLVLAPLAAVIKLMLLVWVEKRLKSVQSYEGAFLSLYAIITLVMSLFGVLVLQLSTLSTTLVMFGSVFLAATVGSRAVHQVLAARRGELTK